MSGIGRRERTDDELRECIEHEWTDRINECWEWQRSVTDKGYGQQSYRGRLWRAHRLAYHLFVGPCPRLLRHACDADTGFIHAIDRMLETWPDARVAIMVNADESWERWRPGDAIRESVDRDYGTALEQLLGFAYPCDAQRVTTDVREARGLWEHCLPTVPFCAERWRILKDMNVQVQLDSLPRRFTS